MSESRGDPPDGPAGALQLVAVAVVQSGGRVLIGPRSGNVPLAGLWEFPGGKVAAGEAPAEAAARECLEETGLAIRIGRRLCEVVHGYPHGRLRISFYAAEPVDPAQGVRSPFRWDELGELSSYSFPPANAEVLACLQSPEE